MEAEDLLAIGDKVRVHLYGNKSSTGSIADVRPKITQPPGMIYRVVLDNSEGIVMAGSSNITLLHVKKYARPRRHIL